MEEILTTIDMKNSDLNAIKNGIDSKKLMYEAAYNVYLSCNWYGKIGVFCGTGNNAGDGFALACILKENNFDVEIILIKEKFSTDGLYYFNICKKMNIPYSLFSFNLKKYDIIVDALLGTGIKGNLKKEYMDCINYINENSKYVISIDVNSGINSDNGLYDYAVKSDLTVSIGYYKAGMFLNMAKDIRKEIINKKISINRICEPFYLIEKKDVSNFFKPRLNYSNKGDYGYVAIMGGSSNYPGAPRLALLGQTALYSGCGVSRLIVPDEIYELMFKNVLETTIYKMTSLNGKMIFDQEKLDDSLKNIKVLAFGVGLDKSIEYEKILSYILKKYEIILVIDADGINTLANMDLEILNNTKCKIVLTPHLKEFSRLIKKDVNYIKENLIELQRNFTNKYNVTLLLKGPTTTISYKNKIYFVDAGTPGMAKAGSGDVLTGILTGLLGYNKKDIPYVTAIAAYINGLSGEYAKKEFGEVSMVASDTAKMLKYVIKDLIK